MANITITIPDEKLTRVTNAFSSIYPIPTDANDDPLFTQNAWAKERVRQFIRDTVYRYEEIVVVQNAKSNVTMDDEIAS